MDGRSSPRDATLRAADALRRCEPADDPLFPVALLRGHELVGRAADPDALIASWAPGVTRETGSVRYRWTINPRFAGPSFSRPMPPWVGPPETWAPWRAADAPVWFERQQRADAFTEALITPLILADTLQLLADTALREDAFGLLARAFLDESLRKVRRDAAAWVQELQAWADTWALWAMARRPAALTLLYPFASAIADSYAASARRDGDVVRGTRFPFHGVPIASGSAQLATGLVALGVHPNLAGALVARVRLEQHPDGGWGDGAGAPDLLTTLVAADLLAGLDPAYDPRSTARWFAGQQRADGWWRACGPEATWLTVEILAWLQRAERPFAERFTWPHLAVTNRDRRTGLPFYGYFSDLERLFQAAPGLGASSIDIAFIDLAGFGLFNNAFGMEMGDRVLRAFAQSLTRVPDAMAIRDGGDEFIVLGTPTGTGLPERMAAIRAIWADEFAATFGQGVVAARVLTGTTTAARIVHARNVLGIEIARLKDRWGTVGPAGVQEDLGPL